MSLDKILESLNFWSKLTPTNKVLVTLLSVTIYIGWSGYDSQQRLEAERDKVQDKYDVLYIRYTKQVDENQAIQNNLKDGCLELFRDYQEKKDAEIQGIRKEFQEDYLELLNKYKDFLIKNNNKNKKE